jgi:4-amino-4-deoxy-L-arabinose transferase-like glycosyltransferase
MTTVSLPQRVIARSKPRAGVVASVRPLVLILSVQAAASLLTLRNTAFQDEGLYVYAGRHLVSHMLGGPAPLDHYAFYFSGYPYVYPLIGGALDLVGGLELARSLSLVCMLGVSATVYAVTNKLFDRPAAVFAAATYASTGVVLFVGRLATYDALCLFFIALSTGIAVKAATSRRPWSALALGPVLVLAVATKYAALLFVLPVLGLLGCLTIAFRGWWAAGARLALALITFALSVGAAYRLIDKAALHAIAGSTTHRAVGLRAPRLDLVTQHVLKLGGLTYSIALCGLILILVQHRRLRIPALLVFASAWLTPAYHIYKQEPISFDKHLAYALFFAAPLAGYALAWLSGYAPRQVSGSHRGYWLAGAAVVLALFTVGLRQSHGLYHDWANTWRLGEALHTQLRNGSGRIFAEDIEVARFGAKDISQEWQWQSFYYPYYTVGDHTLVGAPAIIQAVKHRYYSFVELSFNYFPSPAYSVAKQMAATRNYDLIAIIPFVNSYGRGHFYLWRSTFLPGHGRFKSLAQLKTSVWQ